MSGIGSQYSFAVETMERDEIQKSWEKRTRESGAYPGTHTLGAEFGTQPREDVVVRSEPEQGVRFHANID